MILVLSQRSSVHQAVATLLPRTDVLIATVQSMGSVSEALRAQEVSVVVCESDYPGGGWKAILAMTAVLPKPPLLVVTSVNADAELWAEVLNLGGYDVLPQPLELAEVRQILLQAHAAFKRQPRQKK